MEYLGFAALAVAVLGACLVIGRLMRSAQNRDQSYGTGNDGGSDATGAA